MINLEITTLVVGPLATNGYLVVDKRTKEGFILDPGAESEKMLRIIKNQGLIIKAVLVTHCHFDHLGAVAELENKLRVPFLVPQGEEKILAAAPTEAKVWTGQKVKIPPQPDGFLKDGDQVNAGGIDFQVISTPGHSPAGISLYSRGENLLFSGDTLFAGSIGRVDLPGGSEEEMNASLRKLIALPEETSVFPGHGEKTTIGEEKIHNPFLQGLKNYSSFF